MENKDNFEMNKEWFLNFDTVMGESYTIYFSKNGNDWVFGLYIKDGGCIAEKKCHKWYEPNHFVYFVEKCILHPDDSNVDCAYLD